MKQLVDLGFQPRAWQAKALSALKRFSVLIVHRRGGKTLAAVMKLIDAALRCDKPRGRYAYIAPELKQAKAVAWDYLKHYVAKIPGYVINESETWVQVPNNAGGARIRIYGADAPDSLRGLYFDGFVLDEVAQVKKHVWGEVLIPTLADRQGWALLIGTPKGVNLLSDRYYEAVNDQTWYAEAFDYRTTGVLPESELATMKANMTPREWRQEMECDFSASGDDILISFDLVKAAMGKHVSESAYAFAGRVIGVDVALGGGDKTVIQRRQGLAAFVPQELNMSDPQDIADVVALNIDAFQADACFIDDTGGFGSGVISRLNNLGFSPIGVQFGAKARNERFRDRSAEMWVAMRDWLEQGGCLPKDNHYLLELTSRRYGTDNATGKLELESKAELRKRGLKSPDYADALALTFASPVHRRDSVPTRVVDTGKPLEAFLQHTNRAEHNYDPMQRFAEEQKRTYGQ